MPAPPAKNDISGSGATPSNAQARAGFGALWETLFGTAGLLGSTGAQVDAWKALGLSTDGSTGDRNLLINGNFLINQRGYVSGTATTGANQFTVDRWRVTTAGQNLTFGPPGPDVVATAPAGGVVQVVEGQIVAGGVYTLSWAGSATATVNGVAIANGGNTASLPANTNIIVEFKGGFVTRAQLELGTNATPYQRRHPTYERLLCQRYFRLGGRELQGIWVNSNICRFKWGINPPMRTTPSVALTTSSFAVEDWSQASYPTTTGSLNLVNVAAPNFCDFNLQGWAGGTTTARFAASLTSDIVALTAEL